MLLAFATGLSSGYLIRAESGNYMWGSAVGVLCLLPALVTGIAAIASPRLRRLAWAVYLAHLASGAWNLWLFARDGLILPA